MTSRLQGGVTPGPDRTVWAGGSGPVPPGRPVVVGPRDATPDRVSAALRALSRLVAACGPVAAAADVDLGDGFASGRVEGGAGDRRDAVLAVLADPDFADRMGDRRAVLTALFGPEATRPLGAAARAAVEARRWAALRFAVAVSDLLGPEQLVEVLALPAPADGDPFPDGLPSVVGGHLARVMAGVPRPRRLVLLTDLWARTGVELAVRARLERLRASQSRTTHLVETRARWDDLELAGWLPSPATTVLEAARWHPPAPYWQARCRRIMHDAQAATVLARLAVTAADHGLDEALSRHRPELEAVHAAAPPRPGGSSDGRSGLPALPGTYVRDIVKRVPPGEPVSAGVAAYVRQRLARAADYAWVVLWDAAGVVHDVAQDRDSAAAARGFADWAGQSMAEWRAQVGYFSPDRTTSWPQRPLPPGGDRRPLPARLGDHPPSEVETAGDVLWYGELADALARLLGRPAAEFEFDDVMPSADPDPWREDEPLVPPAHSIALAAAGTAQLVDLGGVLPPRVRNWPGLVGGLLGSAGLAAAMTGEFAVPEEMAEADGTTLPGSAARVEVARTGGQLASWAAYMGNCIAGGYYQDEATAGRSVLVALRAADDRLLANAELCPAGGGWRIEQMKARFNEDPDPVLHRRLTMWVGSLGRPLEPAGAEAGPPPARVGSRRPVAAHRKASIDLNERAAATLAESPPALAALLGAGTNDPMVALRRATPAELLETVREAMYDPETLRPLWIASADRPLARTIGALPETAATRFAPLTADEPLPGALRGPARRTATGAARTADLVALRVRAVLGRLLRADDPDLAAAVRARPDPGLLRSAALAVTTWGDAPGRAPVMPPGRVTVPGYPRTSLTDASWLAAWPGAVELGAEPAVYADRLAAYGLLLPVSWTAGHWPALWAKAAATPGRDAARGRR